MSASNYRHISVAVQVHAPTSIRDGHNQIPKHDLNSEQVVKKGLGGNSFSVPNVMGVCSTYHVMYQLSNRATTLNTK